MTKTTPEAPAPAVAPDPLAGHDRLVNLRLRLDVTHNFGPGTRRLRLRGGALFWSALVAMPAILLWCLVARYAVDVPFWDEWTIGGLLQALDAGTLTPLSLFRQHNEHRVLVPLGLQVGVATVMGWDTRAMMWAIQLVLVAMLAGCIRLWRQSLDSRVSWTLASLACVSLLLFTPAQYQNLFWGFQICFYFPPACLVAGVIVSSSRTMRLGKALAITALLATIASLSIFPGLLVWPMLAGAMMFGHGIPSRRTAWPWTFWSAAAAAVFALYFYTYRRPLNTPSLGATLAQPFSVVAGFATSVGAPFAFGQHPVRSSIIAGAAAVAALLWLLSSIWRRRADTELVRRAGPWLVLSSFGMLVAGAITLGRVGYGYVALLEPRYAALTVWVFVGIVMLAAIVRERSATVAATRVWAAVCATILVLYAVSFPHHLAGIRYTYRERLQSLAVYTFAEAASEGWPMVPPWVNWPNVRQGLFNVEQGGWRRLRPEAPVWMNTDSLRPSCDFGAVESLLRVEPRVMATGWAFLPMAGRAADAVLLTVGSSRHIAALQPPLAGRGDIGARFNTIDALVSGWFIDAQPAAGQALEFWALDAETMRAYRLCQQQ